MIFLEALNTTFTTITVLNTLNTLNCSKCAGNCSDVAYLVLQTSFADCLAVLGVVAFSLWRIDYQTNFFVHNTAGQGTLTLEALTQPFCGLLKHYQPAIKSTTSGRPASILFTTSHLIHRFANEFCGRYCY